MLGWALGASLLVLRLEVDNAPEVHFPAEDPAIVFDRELRQRFPQDQSLIALFAGSDIYGAEPLGRLHQTARVIESHPLVERVLGPTTIEKISSEDDAFVVGPLVDVRRLAVTDDRKRRDRVLTDRFAPRLVASTEGTSIALVVRPVVLTSSRERDKVEQHVRKAIDDAGLSDSLAAVTGSIALDVAQLRSVFRDCLVFIPGAAGTGLLVIWWLFRRRLAVIVSFLAIWTTVTSTVAVIAALGRPFTLVAAMIPALEAALTITLLIHVFTSLSQMARRGYVGAERVDRALTQIRRPARYTTLTTTAGLLSLSLSPVQSIQTFGLVVGIGAALTYPVVMGLLPPMLRAWDNAAWPSTSTPARYVDAMVQSASRLAIRRPLLVLVIGLGTTAIATPYILEVKAETDLFEFFDDQHPLSVSTRRVEKEIGGVGNLDLVIDAPNRDDLKEPARMRAIGELQSWLEGLPEVDSAVSFVDIVEEMHWAFHGEHPAYRTVPETRVAVSQYLLIYDGDDLYDLVDRDFQRARLPLRINVRGASEIRTLIDEIEAHLAAHPVAELEVRVSGMASLFAELETLLIRGQHRSLWTALTIIGLLMVAFWRSVPAALLCMVPNVSPIALIFIIMGIFGIWLDLATAMIASVALGVAVDDTIHLYHGYVQRRARGIAIAPALARSYALAGRAIMGTTVVLCALFLIMASSEFIPTVEFGVLTAVGLLAALAFDLLILPALIVAAGTCRARRSRR